MRSSRLFVPFGVSAIIILVATAYFYYSLPKIIADACRGPDGSVWVRLFIAWMGFLCAAFCVVTALTQKNTPDLWEKFGYRLIITLCAGSICFIGMQRMASGLPFTESYNEGMSIRLAHGRSIYPDTEQAPVGTVYTPLYFLITALVYAMLPGFIYWGRLVSLLSFLVTILLVYRIVMLRTHDAKKSPAASVLFLSTYAPMYMLYDQSGVDTLLMCCTAATALYFLKNSARDDWRALFFAGLACFTKQSGILPFMVVAVFVITARRPIKTWVPVLVWGVIGCLLLLTTHGRAIYYCVTLPSAHGFRSELMWKMVFGFLVLQIPLWAGALSSTFRGKKDLRFFIYCTAVLISSVLGIMKNGGYVQVFFPVEPLLCVAAIELLYSRKILLVAQVVMGVYNPFHGIFSWQTYHTADRLIVSIASRAKQDVWIPMESYLYPQTGKKTWDNFCALFGPQWANQPVSNRLITALREKQFECIVIRKNSMGYFDLFDLQIKELIDKGYQKRDTGDVVIFKRRE